jgi:Flp pilus assembly pilin Flp
MEVLMQDILERFRQEDERHGAIAYGIIACLLGLVISLAVAT